MKRWTAVFCAAALALILTAFSLPVAAQAQEDAAVPGTVAGQYYYTDIKAYLKDTPIKAYNIGGRTVIEAESLNWFYGFDVVWNGNSRTVTVDDHGNNATMLQAGQKIDEVTGTPGTVAGTYYYTDIKTTLNGEPIESYNIGGATVIPLEAMAEHGYDVMWDAEKREIRVRFAAVSMDTDLGTFHSEAAFTKNHEYMCAVYDGAVTIDGKQLVTAFPKYYILSWQNTAFVPIKPTLDALGLSYSFEQETGTLAITYDGELAEFESTEPMETNDEGVRDFYYDSVPLTITVNGKNLPILTGPNGSSLTNGVMTRREMDAWVYQGVVYVPGNTIADILGLACDNGLDLYTP